MSACKCVCAQHARALVAHHLDNEHKVELWFRLPNPQLDWLSPNDMVRYGRARRLLRIVERDVVR